MMKLGLMAALLAGTMAAAPLAAQERVAAGTGVAPSTRSNSAERPLQFAAQVPAGAALIIPVTAPLDVAKAAPGLPAATATAIQQAAEALSYKPAELNNRLLTAVGGHPAVLLVGIAPKTAGQPSATELADAAGRGVQVMRNVAHPLAVLAGGLPAGSAQPLALGAALAQYRYDRLKSAPIARPVQPIIIASNDMDAAARWDADGRHVADGVRLARDLITTPANELYPEIFVQRVQQALKGVANVRITVLDEAQMRAQNMGALLSVSAGSTRPARMIAVEYRGGPAGEAPLALVGKGITFDTGGISIKPNSGMWEMKGDMSGAAAAMGAIIAAAKRGARANVVAVAPLAENMPGGNASRPGDVIRTLNGQTIEIWSTDAEGRLALADANQWTIKQFQPRALVNLATLTGSVVGALGVDFAGLFARNDDLANRLLAAGENGSEPLWRLPLIAAYKARTDSEIADIRNSGGGPGAGVAAHFISFLTPAPTPWAHIDMAAVDRAETSLPTVPVGPRGFGVRLFDQLIRGYEAR